MLGKLDQLLFGCHGMPCFPLSPPQCLFLLDCLSPKEGLKKEPRRNMSGAERYHGFVGARKAPIECK